MPMRPRTSSRNRSRGESRNSSSSTSDGMTEVELTDAGPSTNRRRLTDPEQFADQKASSKKKSICYLLFMVPYLWVRGLLARRPLLGRSSGLCCPFSFVTLKISDIIVILCLCGFALSVLIEHAIPYLSYEGCFEMKRKEEECRDPTYRFKKFGQHFGIVAHWMMAFMFFPITRNSILYYVFGLSFDKAVKWHRWIGRGLLFVSIAHGVAFLPNWAQKEAIMEKLTGKFKITAGVLATVVLLFINIFSMDGVRRTSYRLFWIMHVTLVPGLVIFVLLHYEPEELLSKMWLPFTLFVVDKLYRYFYVSRSPWRIKSARLIGNNITKLQFVRNYASAHENRAIKAVTNATCGWVYLNIPSIAKTQTHPFSICNINVTADGSREEFDDGHVAKISVYVKSSDVTQFRRGGGTWTEQLLERAKTSSLEGDTVYVDGPYGNIDLPFNLHSYDGLVLSAGGIGITPLLPVLQQLASDVTCPQTSFIWCVRDPQLVYEFAPALNWCSKNQNIHISLFYTSKLATEEHDFRSTLKNEIKVFTGIRPEYRSYLVDTLLYINDSKEDVGDYDVREGEVVVKRSSSANQPQIAGLVCGPQAMIQKFFRVLARAQHHRGDFRLHLHQETFHF